MRKQAKHPVRASGTWSHGAVPPCYPRGNTVRAPRHSEAATTKAYVIRGLFALLTLALVLWANPFALGQRKQRGFSKRTLAFPSSLLEQQKKQQGQTAADSVRNRHQAPIGKQAEPPPTPSAKGVPSGIDCDSAPGIVIHDDGTVENGYGGGPGITVIYADKFTPATYPSSYRSVCLAFNRLCAGPTSYPIEIVVFDDDGPGGSPGTKLGAMPVTITNIPIFPDPTPAWNSFDISSLNIVVNDGSVYIGARWSSDSLAQVYMSSDENGSGSGGGYWFSNIDDLWAPIQNVFPLYRAMFVRAVEQPGGKFGGSLTKSIAGGAITNRVGNPNQTFTGNHAVQGCGQYVITQGTDRIVPSDTNIGSDCDECDTFIALPFNFQLYDTTYTGVNVSSNGRLDFVNANEPGGFITACLPSPPNYFNGLPYDNTIFPLWQDQLTSASAPGCASFPGGTCGVFTSVTGSAPNRIFNIEWRTVLYADQTAPQNFEVRLYENDPNQRFDVIFGTLTPPIFAERQWVSGVQGDGILGFYTEDFCICPPASPAQNESRAYMLIPCGTPSPTPTPTATPTPSSTPRPTPTPRGSPIPRVRPTPHPRPSP
jgi:hypothetical protein